LWFFIPTIIVSIWLPAVKIVVILIIYTVVPIIVCFIARVVASASAEVGQGIRSEKEEVE
jgi:hypothetical protein